MKKTLNYSEEKCTQKSLCTSASQNDDTSLELYSEAVQSLIKYRKLFNLHNDTVFLAIDILKKFIKNGGELTCQTATMVIISCLMLASKYNEIYPPKLSEITEAFDYFGDEELILQMEGEVLMQCQFQIPTQDNLMLLLQRKIGDNTAKMEQSLKVVYKKISNKTFANFSNVKILESLCQTEQNKSPKSIKEELEKQRNCLGSKRDKRRIIFLSERDLNILTS